VARLPVAGDQWPLERSGRKVLCGRGTGLVEDLGSGRGLCDCLLAVVSGDSETAITGTSGTLIVGTLGALLVETSETLIVGIAGNLAIGCSGKFIVGTSGRFIVGISEIEVGGLGPEGNFRFNWTGGVTGS